MTLTKETLRKLILEAIEDESRFPALKDFKKLGRGIQQELQDPQQHPNELTPELEEQGRQVVKWIRTQEREQQQKLVAIIAKSFGFMTFDDFIRIQNKMINASKGQLGED
jgi:hypothetical protein